MTVMILIMLQREELRLSAAARLCDGRARDHRQHRGPAQGGAAHREHGYRVIHKHGYRVIHKHRYRVIHKHYLLTIKSIISSIAEADTQTGGRQGVKLMRNQCEPITPSHRTLDTDLMSLQIITDYYMSSVTWWFCMYDVAQWLVLNMSSLITTVKFCTCGYSVRCLA